jgi:hypothetical protein
VVEKSHETVPLKALHRRNKEGKNNILHDEKLNISDTE